METFRKGDIVLFPFPYTDLSTRKIRPCLVVSNEMVDDIILCQITSQNTKTDSFAIPLKKEETIKGTLSIDSFVRTNMIFTASKYQIIKKLCSVDIKKYIEITNSIKKIIG